MPPPVPRVPGVLPSGLRVLLLACLAAAWGGCSADGPPPLPAPENRTCPGDAAADPARARVRGGSSLQDKNYYLLTLFQELPDAAAAVALDPRLRAIGEDRRERLRQAVATCGSDMDCLAGALLFTAEDAGRVGDELARLAGEPALGCGLVEAEMRPSGMFLLHAGSTDPEMLRSAWLDTVEGLRVAFDSHARSLPPDDLARIASDALEGPAGRPASFFEPLLGVVLAALVAQGRDEAGRYEPLEAGENRAACARAVRIDWAAYPYPAILVPGLGPEDEGVPLSPLGRFRCHLAAERFAAGTAPFLVLSGGHVHPDRTPFAEALEMKRYLTGELGVPEDALFVDPHARHTTTNLRNLARLLHRYGLPVERPSLVTTDPFQALYIARMLDDRCARELGYLPYRSLNPISAFDVEVLPDIRSLHADPSDPLDP